MKRKNPRGTARYRKLNKRKVKTTNKTKTRQTRHGESKISFVLVFWWLLFSFFCCFSFRCLAFLCFNISCKFIFLYFRSFLLSFVRLLLFLGLDEEDEPTNEMGLRPGGKKVENTRRKKFTSGRCPAALQGR